MKRMEKLFLWLVPEKSLQWTLTNSLGPEPVRIRISDSWSMEKKRWGGSSIEAQKSMGPVLRLSIKSLKIILGFLTTLWGPVPPSPKQGVQCSPPHPPSKGSSAPTPPSKQGVQCPPPHPPSKGSSAPPPPPPPPPPPKCQLANLIYTRKLTICRRHCHVASSLHSAQGTIRQLPAKLLSGSHTPFLFLVMSLFKMWRSKSV